MRREGQLGGKPSNHSKKTGKCRAVGCEQCHESWPLNKSRGKGKGRVKRLVSDIPSTHLISDWRVSKAPSLKMAQKWDLDTDDEEEVEPNDGYEPEGWALSISLLLDTALQHKILQDFRGDGYGDSGAYGCTYLIQESMDAVRQKAEEADASQQGLEDVDDNNTTDVDMLDFDMLKNEFEVFKCEIEARGSLARVAKSADSWFGIELSDADESDLDNWEDDWSLVGDEVVA